MIPVSDRKPTPTSDFFDKALDLYVESVDMCSAIFDPNKVIPEKYWYAVDVRNSIISCMNNMISNLTHADKIFILSENDYAIRRNLMNKAIGDIETAIKFCELSKRTLGIKASRFTVFFNVANRTIDLIKDWRKSDNKVLKRLRENS